MTASKVVGHRYLTHICKPRATTKQSILMTQFVRANHLWRLTIILQLENITLPPNKMKNQRSTSPTNNTSESKPVVILRCYIRIVHCSKIKVHNCIEVFIVRIDKRLCYSPSRICIRLRIIWLGTIQRAQQGIAFRKF